MQITQGNWQATINPERGSLGLTRTQAVDLMLLAAGNTYKRLPATGRSRRKPFTAASKGLPQAARLQPLALAGHAPWLDYPATRRAHDQRHQPRRRSHAPPVTGTDAPAGQRQPHANPS